MLLIDCPYCGPRPEIEFSYGGQAHLARPARPAELDDQQWVEYLYLRANPRGPHAERWRHLRGCGRFFNAIRDTSTDRLGAVYRLGAGGPAAAGVVSSRRSATRRRHASPRPTGSARSRRGAALRERASHAVG